MATSKRTTTKSASTALAKVDNWAVSTIDDMDGFLSTIASNVGTDGLTPQDLEKVKVPTGGGRRWEVQSPMGDEELEAVEGVIVFHKTTRAFWHKSLDEGGGGTPPDCWSDDAITGHGDIAANVPGAACAKCPMAQFGTKNDGDGRGQACKLVKLLFVLTPDEMLPKVLQLPPTSFKAAKKFMIGLASRAIPYYGVTVKIGLAQETNPDGLKYSFAQFTMGDRLPDDFAQRMASYAESMRSVFEAVRVDDQSEVAEAAG